jgi:hypothetical protein
MGGRGSGGHNSKGRLRDVQCARLDVHEQARGGKLKLGSRGRLFGMVRFEVTGGPDAQQLVLEFPCRSESGERLEPLRQIITCYWRKAHYGGRYPRGAFFHMDVATLELLPNGQRLLRLSHLMPTTLLGFFDDKATYEFEILVAADNARPCRRVLVKFAYDPQNDELQITPLNRSRYPWWSVWRRWTS